jgi:hypothetical protein
MSVWLSFMDSLQDRRLIKPHKRYSNYTKWVFLSIVSCYVSLLHLLHFCYEENQEKMARHTAFSGLMLILSCGTICSSAVTPFSFEDKLQELEVRLEAKIEANNAQLEEKVTQLEVQLELNVSLPFSLTQSFTVGKHFRFSMTE